nr:MAG TPA: hypothetical protein [Caudoviricetes sp.]
MRTFYFRFVEAAIKSDLFSVYLKMDEIVFASRNL